MLENGTLSELVAVQKDHLCVVPDNVDDAAAAGLPVAYLTADVTLKAAGFQAAKTVLAPAIGGSVGNATTQLARALGAKHAISTTTSHAKAGTGQRTGLFRGDRPFRRRVGRGRAPSDRRLRGRHCRGCHRRTDPERSARNSGARWEPHHTRVCGE